MRTVIASMLMTVDGFFEGPNREFVPPPWNHQLDRYSDEIHDECDTLLYGRVTFDYNKAFWMAAETDPSSPAAQIPFARKMNAARKVVFSRTLPDDPGWNARVARGDLVEEVTRLKRQPGKSMVMFGSAQLLSDFVKLDLIDEYRFMINPMLLGRGSPLFKGAGDRLPLKLLSAQPLENGVLLTRYARDRAA